MKRNKSKRRNPSNDSQAKEMSEKFHGRPSTNLSEAYETETYDENLAGLGELVEFEILQPDGKSVIPISWQDSPKRPIVCCDGNGENIELVGGDQGLDLDELDIPSVEMETNKREIVIGSIFSISYFADKHHLVGPKIQAKGTEYIHEFGEDGGELPTLVYDRRDKKMKVVGGSYKVEAEGIKN